MQPATSAAPVRSQPAYAPLAWDPLGRTHLLLLDTRDPAAAALVARLAMSAPSAALQVITCGPAGVLQDLASTRHMATATPTEAVDALEAALARACMGLRLYLAGPEDLLWQASRVAAAAGLGEDVIRRERLGPPARPLWCVHCRHRHPAVRESLQVCEGCGRTLLVRDHFSRRLGAYMGVQADAEVPGLLPEVRELES
jgi:hypothetical protein